MKEPTRIVFPWGIRAGGGLRRSRVWRGVARGGKGWGERFKEKGFSEMQKALAFDSAGAGVAGGLLVYFAECAGVVLLAVREYAVAARASPAFVLVVVVREGDVDNFGGHF